MITSTSRPRVSFTARYAFKDSDAAQEKHAELKARGQKPYIINNIDQKIVLTDQGTLHKSAYLHLTKVWREFTGVPGLLGTIANDMWEKTAELFLKLSDEELKVLVDKTVREANIVGEDV